MFSLFTDAELADLITQYKAALPKALAGQLTRVGDTEFAPNDMAAFKAFGDALAQEQNRRAGHRSRFTSLAHRGRRNW
jgi:hypothetical protein